MDPSNVQQLHLLQQQRQQPGFNGYGPAFIASHPNLMYARDMSFYPNAPNPEYQVPYNIQPPFNVQPEKASASSGVEASKHSAPPANTPRHGKKASEKTGSTYASRHQAAESRRRQRINDR
jgi:hypothetical protein